MAKRQQKAAAPKVAETSVQNVSVSARVVAKPAGVTLLGRLVACQRAAERNGRHAEAAALNTVIVSVSEAKHKARQARAVVDVGLFSLLDELEGL